MFEAQYAAASNKANSLITTHKCKITVLMRKWAQTLADKYLANPNVGPCSRFREGQEFFVDVYEFFLMLNDKFYSETWY